MWGATLDQRGADADALDPVEVEAGLPKCGLGVTKDLAALETAEDRRRGFRNHRSRDGHVIDGEILVPSVQHPLDLHSESGRDGLVAWSLRDDEVEARRGC